MEENKLGQPLCSVQKEKKKIGITIVSINLKCRYKVLADRSRTVAKMACYTIGVTVP